MRASYIIGIVAVSAASLTASTQGASAEVLYLSDLNSASGNAVAYADGAAAATGDAASSYLTAETRAEFSAFNAPDGVGGFSVGVGFASGSVLGRASSTRTVTDAPVATPWTTGTTTTTTELEALKVAVFDYEEMTSQFASPSSATFTFHGEVETSLEDAVVTTVASTRTKTPLTEAGSPGAASAPAKTTTIGPTMAKRIFAPPKDPNISISSYARAEVSTANFSIYTFEVLGAAGGGVAITYATQASLDGAFAYGIALVDDSAQMTVGMVDAIGSNASGTETWSLGAPGVYSLIVSGRSDVAASASHAYELLGAANFDWSSAAFQMRVWTESDPTVPELSTWALMLIGFAGLGYVGHRKARGHRGQASVRDMLNRNCGDPDSSRLRDTASNRS